MDSLWICLLALISTALAVPNTNPLGLLGDPRTSLKEHVYGTEGATPANIKKYPYAVSITLDTDQSLIGGGAILNKNLIITSAYPLETYLSLAENVSVRLGSNRADRGGQKLKISEVTIHRMFNNNYWYNVALIRTRTEMKLGKQAKAIKLASSSLKPGAKAQVVGFGGKATKNNTGGHLQVATVQIESQYTCESVHGYVGPTGQCADAKGVGPCYGDFGNPLVYKNKLVGFFLGGDICNFYDLPEVYSNVPALKAWIEDHIKNPPSVNTFQGINNEELHESHDVVDNEDIVVQDEDQNDGDNK